MATTLDSVFLGFTNAGVGATWTISTMTGTGTGYVEMHAGAFRAADSLGPRHHGYVRLADPVTTRWLSIVIDQDGAEALYAGVLMLGRAFEKHREYGQGRNLIDTGARSDLPSGGFGTGEGVVKASFAFSFIDLTDMELFQLDAIKRDRGLRKPVLVVEDAELVIGQNEAIHYGVFERFQAWERADPANTRWAGSVVEWA